MRCIICYNERPNLVFNVKRNILGKDVIFKICDDCGKDVRLDDKDVIDKILEKPNPIVVKHNGYRDYDKYGITMADYNQMYINQQGRCAICNTHQIYLKKALAIDHDHNTGKVRGLLCSNCNLGIGNLKDSIKSLKNAIKYLGGEC